MTNNITACLAGIEEISRLSPYVVDKIQRRRLDKTLTFARVHVPYYRNMPDAFEDIPFLTKDIIRKQGNRLYSDDHQYRGSYLNTSGGSTGEPVRFLQDRGYRKWNIAHKLFMNCLQGVRPGDCEIKLWGAGRDIHFKDIGVSGMKLSARLRYWLFNVYHLDSFKMSEEIMNNHIRRWNRLKPVLVWSYLSSILEFSRYVRENNIKLHRPKSIICGSETFSEKARTELESVFGCSIVNQYGGREVGVVGIECPDCHYLHIFSLHNFVEVIDGEILITTLNNYSMPLIRYKIGDTAETGDCECGRPWLTVKKVTGRKVDHFKKRDGIIIYGERFTHIFYFKNHVKQFQVIQRSLDEILVKIVPTLPIEDWMLEQIRNEIREVMGEIDINFDVCSEIDKTVTGKRRYTICEVS